MLLSEELKSMWKVKGWKHPLEYNVAEGFVPPTRTQLPGSLSYLRAGYWKLSSYIWQR